MGRELLNQQIIHGLNRNNYNNLSHRRNYNIYYTTYYKFRSKMEYQKPENTISVKLLY